MPGICSNAECKNKPGSYECDCKQGFRPNDQGVCDGKNVHILKFQHSRDFEQKYIN